MSVVITTIAVCAGTIIVLRIAHADRLYIFSVVTVGSLLVGVGMLFPNGLTIASYRMPDAIFALGVGLVVGWIAEGALRVRQRAAAKLAKGAAMPTASPLNDPTERTAPRPGSAAWPEPPIANPVQPVRVSDNHVFNLAPKKLAAHYKQTPPPLDWGTTYPEG